MKSTENAIKPTQKPICFSVQELLQRYKSNSKDSVQTQSEYQELFQTVQTDNRSLEGPESIIFDKKMNSGQESTELTIRQQQVEELPLQSQNDVIMQINHLHSIFKYLQTEDNNSKISTKTNSQHSIIKSKDVENKPTSQNRIQSKNISQQIKRDHSPNRISIRTNICQTTRQNCQQSKSPSYHRNKSPLVSARPSNQTPKIQSKATPSQSPFRISKENINSQVKTDHSGNKPMNNKIQTQHQQSYVVVDFTKCPSQRVLIKQDVNRPSMNVQLSLKSLIQK